MARNGRKRKYETAEQLQAAIDGYFTAVDKHNNEAQARGDTWREYYTYEGMLLHLDLSPDTISRWEAIAAGGEVDGGRTFDDEQRQIYKEFARIIKRAVRRLGNELQQVALNSPNKQSFAIFCLKQKHYGGYADKPPETQEAIKIDIKIKGDGGDNPFA